MKIAFHGAAREVTGSMHLIEVNDRRILLDCGLYQGRRAETYARNQHFPFDPASIDAVVLSHAHIDHSGNLPNLVKQGFTGNIWCTAATRNLCTYMLMDSGFIHEQDAAYVNKKRRRQGEPPIEPLYTQRDAAASLPQFVGVGLHRPIMVADGVELTYTNAGHILGAAHVQLDIREHATGKRWRLVFSGDIGRPHMPIIRDPKHTATPDVLIMESTYGGRDHVPNDQAEDHLAAIMNKICGRRGKLIIPAFSVGRTQEIVYKLTQLRRAGKISSCPIFVDSPLAVKATDVFDRHPECYDAEIRKIMREQGDPFGMEDITYIKSVEESKALNDRKGPFTVISASGMMEGGRVLHHLRNSISNPENAILIVGYQAEHTLGRKILRGDEEVSIYGEPFPVRAEVFVMNELSAHADRGELMDWYEKNEGTPQQVFLVHGDEDQSTALAATMEAKTSAKIEVPHLDQSFTL